MPPNYHQPYSLSRWTLLLMVIDTICILKRKEYRYVVSNHRLGRYLPNHRHTADTNTQKKYSIPTQIVVEYVITLINKHTYEDTSSTLTQYEQVPTSSPTQLIYYRQQEPTRSQYRASGRVQSSVGTSRNCSSTGTYSQEVIPNRNKRSVSVCVCV